VTDDFVTEVEQKLLIVPVLRNVDWRNGLAKDCSTANTERAAYVQ
jgi:hypothetical protein